MKVGDFPQSLTANSGSLFCISVRDRQKGAVQDVMLKQGLHESHLKDKVSWAHWRLGRR